MMEYLQILLVLRNIDHLMYLIKHVRSINILNQIAERIDRL